MRVGLDDNEAVNCRRVVAQVEPGAAADLEDLTAQTRKQVLPALRETRLLGRREHSVVKSGNYRMTHIPIIVDDEEQRGQPPSTRRDAVPTYIMLTRLTADGVKTIKDNPSRVQEVNKEVEQIGVKVLNQWATLGEYDFITVVEAPDEKTMAKLSIEMGSRGSVVNETLTAIDAEEFTSSL